MFGVVHRTDKVAPANGRLILVWVVDFQGVGFRSDGVYDHEFNEFFCNGDIFADEYYITHWMEQPQPPK